MSTSTHAADSLSTWSIDPVHTSVHFKVRHMMISNVRGEFKSVKGTLHFDKDDISRSSVEAEIDASSIHTREEQRDAHLKSADFLDTEKYPAIQFRSTSIRPLHADAVQCRLQFDLTGQATIRPRVQCGFQHQPFVLRRGVQLRQPGLFDMTEAGGATARTAAIRADRRHEIVHGRLHHRLAECRIHDMLGPVVFHISHRYHVDASAATPPRLRPVPSSMI